MSNSLKKYLIFLTLFGISSYMHSESLYKQTNPDILKTINNLEEPTESEQQRMAACALLDSNGVEKQAVPDIKWQAITSVNMIDYVIPQYFKPLTTFGYIDLAHKCAEMTSDQEILATKQAIIHFFDNNSGIYKKLHNAIKMSVQPESIFLLLSRKLNEEDKKLHEDEDKKSYYQSSLLQSLNENSWLIALTKRLKQATLAALVTNEVLQKGNSVSKLKTYNLQEMEKNYNYNSELTSQEKIKLRKDINKLKENLKTYKDVNQETERDFKASLNDSDKSTIESIESKYEGCTFKYGDIVFNDKNVSWSLYGKYWAHHLKHYISNGVINFPEGYYRNLKTALYDMPANTYKSYIRAGDKDDKNLKLKAATAAGLVGTAMSFSIASDFYLKYYLYSSLKGDLDIINRKQKDLLQIAELVKSMHKVAQTIKAHPDLKQLMPEHKTLLRLFDKNSAKTSNDLKKLITRLQSSTFQGQESYYLSDQGKILATHHLFMRIKGELVPYLQALGAIDGYLSIYNVYSQFKHHHNARMCLPRFIQNDTPQIIAKDFWHPLIDPNKVITNNLSMGTDGQNSNLIITGPNAGGKTTSLMALIINIIMAQSFGIAPASELSLTPFDKVHSYLDITTNLLQGESLFKAEVNRSKLLKESILSCTPGQKAFTIIDEIFSGTAPDAASKVGFTFAEQLGNINHSMAIITTHFPRLTDLETETTKFENFKVADAHIAQNGQVIYPFKLVKGKSTQNIAEHMLEHEGII